MRKWSDYIFSEDILFEERAEEVFNFQKKHNPVFNRFCKALGFEEPGPIENLPLLPVRAFKDSVVTSLAGREPELEFKSSGTGDMERSRHLVYDPDLYRHSLLKGFNSFYNLSSAVIWGYTPGYSDNPHSSLIWMINELIEQDDTGLSRFLPLGRPLDSQRISDVEESGRRLILFGAAFGLLEMAENDPVELPADSLIIETGGMKTHRREITRENLHKKLSEGFGLNRERIHSEYGMAELFSQAYATGGKWFKPVPWMRVTVRNPDNPMQECPPHEEGKIGIVDLANAYTCSFVLTEDRGIMNKKGLFKVLGRWNPKNLRGCNFLVEED